jgi:hypothetical protein
MKRRDDQLCQEPIGSNVLLGRRGRARIALHAHRSALPCRTRGTRRPFGTCSTWRPCRTRWSWIPLDADRSALTDVTRGTGRTFGATRPGWTGGTDFSAFTGRPRLALRAGRAYRPTIGNNGLVVVLTGRQCHDAARWQVRNPENKYAGLVGGHAKLVVH